MNRMVVGVLGVAALWGLACTQPITESECLRYRDRLEKWRKNKGSAEVSAVDNFMKTCPGTTLSRSVHRCLENANDESSFFRCLE